VALFAHLSYNKGYINANVRGVLAPTHALTNVRISYIMATSDSTSNQHLKRCSKCGEEKPATREYFPRSKHSLSGCDSWCHECRRLDQQQRRKRDPESSKIANKRAYEKHRQKRIRGQRDYYNSTKDVRRAVARAYYANHRDVRREYGRKYYINNPHIQKSAGIKYNTRKKQLPAEFTAKQWAECLAYWGYKCVICGRTAGLWHTLAADHWIPINSKDCPGSVATNMIPLCHCYKDGVDGCNNSKGARNPIEWLVGRLGKRKAAKKLAEIEKYFAWVKSQKGITD